MLPESKPSPDAALADRHDNEIEHGRYLAEAGAEDVWGWGSPAGRLRAIRRGKKIREGAVLTPESKVLEVGCGTGIFTEMVAESGAHILAVDISPELLDVARARGVNPEQVEFVCKGFEDAVVDGPFDAVVGSSVLHHLDVEASMRKIHELLKPGGWMSFCEPNMMNPHIAMIKNIKWIGRRLGESPDETAFIRWKLAGLLESIGFTEVCITPFDFLPPITPTPLIPLVKAVGTCVEALPGLREISGSLHIVARKPLG
ncbi:MAG: 2-polyprenyl-3-methyl-5-hydroxy-6-metoxy-1,4-benzoquinol methylase [Kiritimatiellia bacterium]|jgi:2-polyprenyl-3-methyl-5-hydroxy-6-metoxy-1,4-benzoquinol methylase